MTAPRTDIERAFAYAEHHPQNGLTVSPQLAQDQKVVQYQRIVLQLKDTGALINLQIQLDQDLPYFALCSDENLQAYFGRWKLPIESKADLQLFSEVLSERIREAATSDSTAQQYLQQKEYQTQLRELPQAVSQLESTIKEYDVLKAPFTAVMRYVYAAVSQGFSMTEN